MNRDRITAIACAVAILAYWILDLNNWCDLFAQALVYPMAQLLHLFQCRSVALLLDVDTAGTLPTTARLIAFAATLSLVTVPTLHYMRTKKRAALVAMWCCLGTVAFGLLHFVFLLVALANFDPGG